MKKIFIVTEGQSETNFVNKVMVPYFAGRLILIPNTVVTKTDSRHGKTYKGGLVNYDQIRNTLLKTLAVSAKSKDSYVTTMFDFYRLPKDVPGVIDAENVNDPYEKVGIIEKKILEKEGCDGNAFFPILNYMNLKRCCFRILRNWKKLILNMILLH